MKTHKDKLQLKSFLTYYLIESNPSITTFTDAY